MPVVATVIAWRFAGAKVGALLDFTQGPPEQSHHYINHYINRLMLPDSL
jgi:hypothetical protein